MKILRHIGQQDFDAEGRTLYLAEQNGYGDLAAESATSCVMEYGTAFLTDSSWVC